jgi:hypothetical protein
MIAEYSELLLAEKKVITLPDKLNILSAIVSLATVKPVKVLGPGLPSIRLALLSVAGYE